MPHPADPTTHVIPNGAGRFSPAASLLAKWLACAVRNLSSLRPLCSDLRALCVKSFSALLFFAAAIPLIGCSRQSSRDPSALTFLIESSKRFPPDGANRGHYRNPRIDALTDQIRTEMNQEKRKTLCSEAQKILADDLPYIPLWFTDVVSVHRRALGDPPLSPTADCDFLVTIPSSTAVAVTH